VTALRRQGWRFLLVGGSNTLITFLLLAALAHFIDHRVAYTLVFAAGMAYTTALTGRFVFSAESSHGRNAAFVLWYIGVYLIGLLAVHLVDRNGERSGFAVALATVVVTAPLGFLGGRLIYHRSPPVAGADPGTLR
jgi:putative flippase GtrA